MNPKVFWAYFLSRSLEQFGRGKVEMKVHDDAARKLDATFHIEGSGPFDLVFESRGGTMGTATARNIDYAKGLEILLGRLRDLPSVLLRILVDSQSVSSLPIADREVRLDGWTFPLDLAQAGDVKALRLEIGRRQAAVARAGGSVRGPGNPTRRLRISFKPGLDPIPTAQELEKALTRPDFDREAELILRTLERGAETGQGFSADYPTKRAIEVHAMDRARAHYSQKGWTVRDVSADRPYDLHCERGPEQLRVEVKGTRSTGLSVMVTANEVMNAKDHPDATALFVVSYVEVEQSPDGPVADGGRITELNPWRPAAELLQAIAFRYRLPKT